jgi:hypothetical protein
MTTLPDSPGSDRFVAAMWRAVAELCGLAPTRSRYGATAPTSRAMRLALAADALAEGASEAEAARAAGYGDARALRRAIRETAAKEGAQ